MTTRTHVLTITASNLLSRAEKTVPFFVHLPLTSPEVQVSGPPGVTPPLVHPTDVLNWTLSVEKGSRLNLTVDCTNGFAVGITWFCTQ